MATAVDVPDATKDGSPIPAKAGIGLRFQHHQAVLETQPGVAWMEVHTENYMGGGTPCAISTRYVATIRSRCTASACRSAAPTGSIAAHLERVRDVAERFEPGLVSEHLSWSVVGGNYLADLLPLPMTEEALDVVCRHVDQIQDYLKRRILVENPSTYLQFRHSTIPEWEFIAAVAERTGCGILCDVNNIYVSAHNHGWDASAYLAALPPAAIGEIHLAGHSVRQLDDGRTLRIDDHGSRVAPRSGRFIAEALARFGAGADADRMGQRRAADGGAAQEAAHAALLDGKCGKRGVGMPTLLELQRAMRASLVASDDRGIVRAFLADGVEADRLDIYRNTFSRPDHGAAALRIPSCSASSAPISSKAPPQLFVDGASAAHRLSRPLR